MKWMIEQVFAVSYRLMKDDRGHEGAVGFARGAVELAIFFYLTALATAVAHVTGWLIMDEIAKFWPQLHPSAKGLRATDGFAILTLIALIIWSKRHYSKPGRVEGVLKRYGDLSGHELTVQRLLSLWIYASGAILAVMVAITKSFPVVHYLIALHLLLIAYTNWRIYLRWYSGSP